MSRLVSISLGLLILVAPPSRSAEREPWTTSKVVGSPEPPLPYVVEQTLRQIEWKRPIYALSVPGRKHLVVVEEGRGKKNPARARVVADDSQAGSTQLFLENEKLIYGLTFHPRFLENGHVYVFLNGPKPGQGKHNRISRFTVDANRTPQCDPTSEKIILEWPSAGHDGGDLCFGNDGMLYIATGDGTTDSDTNVAGQDVTNLNGGVLRIDVDSAKTEPYVIPKDNPFLEIPEARGELWAFGLRNPWRMSVDRVSGQIWVGNNGQDLWETAHLLGRGHNYGWSVYEGNHPFYLARKLGPAPFVPPTLEHHHREARSLTGGVVYRGKKHADLDGVYVYGDYETGKIWGAKHDGKRLLWNRELADTTLKIAGFANAPRGDLLVVDHGGGIYRLVPRPKPAENAPRPSEFPRVLSKTGVFRSTQDHVVAPGVVPYSINAPSWIDGATAERFIAIPGSAKMSFRDSHAFGLPEGTVLVQTLTRAGRRIETRLLTRQQNEWVGYSYIWNEGQTDAALAPPEGAEIERVVDEGGHPWRVPSRAECIACHSRAAQYVLGVTARQLDRSVEISGRRQSQLEHFATIGIFDEAPKPKHAALVDPYDDTAPTEARARTYLHVNCAPCHVEAGGGNANMDLRVDRENEDLRTIDHHPRHQTFGIQNALLIASGDPDRSVLVERLARSDSGRMPPLGPSRTDDAAVQLMRQWIRTLDPRRKTIRDWTVADLAPHLDELGQGRSFESGKKAFETAGCQQCHRFRGKGGGVGPDLSAKGKKWRTDRSYLLESLINPSKTIDATFATTVIVTARGAVLNGRIESETDKTIVLRTMDAFAKPIHIPKSNVAQRTLSKSSTMPEDTLNFLQRDQILDLLAYLLANGEKDAAAFR